ncbi:hypothetical protein H2198_000792 [Neophaeococcomyces mojaviensis]|uniref:Uncharacterized protein n=1 Tax=Neophaeococcomyces mojaviensis TaxID=3383035 RepID=A0ACC3AJD8_9EURO|nr:hypothetical protein H2198_000792 [Knufia sp. JES_112]
MASRVKARITSTSSPTGIAGLQQTPSAGSGGGLSTGAKAGIGAGVAVAVIAAAIIGALYAMRRRKRDRIADSDRYTPSLGPSMIGGAAFQKENSHYTQSELPSPPMREANPLDRYATPGVSSMTATQRTSIPGNSRTSDISSVSDGGQYRPGPAMAAVPEHNFFRDPVNELPEDSHRNEYLQAGGYHQHGGDTPSQYSDDGDRPVQPHRQPSPVSNSDHAGRLELEGQQTMQSSVPPAGGQSYRGVDPVEPYHTRAQLMKPQGKFDPSHNF